MPKPKVNVLMVGCGFMGRTHSNGYNKVGAFFDLPVEPVKKLLSDCSQDNAERLAARFGWPEISLDWREAVHRPDIDVVDIATPVSTHAEIALEAVRAGKAIICEKPLGITLAEALQMTEAVEKAGLLNYANFNLRTVPAVTLAAEMIQEGALGPINQWRGAFLQGHLIDPNFPLVWRLRKEAAGSGALGDIGSHSLDMAQMLVGPVREVCGMLNTFIKERWIPVRDIGRDSVPSDKKGEVTVDDAVWSLLRFDGGALGSMEASRFATGRILANQFEIYGSQGALAFDFTRMSELQYFSTADGPRTRGWRTINVTAPVHPYMKAWWPAGHPIGYEHTFVHAFANFFNAYAAGKPVTPSFRDAARVQAVMESIELSHAEKRWVNVPVV